jgi:hypothetical protein
MQRCWGWLMLVGLALIVALWGAWTLESASRNMPAGGTPDGSVFVSQSPYTAGWPLIYARQDAHNTPPTTRVEDPPTAVQVAPFLADVLILGMPVAAALICAVLVWRAFWPLASRRAGRSVVIGIVIAGWALFVTVSNLVQTALVGTADRLALIMGAPASLGFMLSGLLHALPDQVGLWNTLFYGFLLPLLIIATLYYVLETVIATLLRLLWRGMRRSGSEPAGETPAPPG